MTVSVFTSLKHCDDGGKKLFFPTLWLTDQATSLLQVPVVLGKEWGSTQVCRKHPGYPNGHSGVFQRLCSAENKPHMRWSGVLNIHSAAHRAAFPTWNWNTQTALVALALTSQTSICIFLLKQSSRYWMWSGFQKTFKYTFSTVCIKFTLDFSQQSKALASPGVSRGSLISQTIMVRFNFCLLFLGMKRDPSIQFKTCWKWASATPSLYHWNFFWPLCGNS